MANKMKAWRRNSLGNHTGRKMKGHSLGAMGATAPELLAGLFERGGIKMPKAESFRAMLNKMLAEKAAEKAAADAATTETEVAAPTEASA